MVGDKEAVVPNQDEVGAEIGIDCQSNLLVAKDDVTTSGTNQLYSSPSSLNRTTENHHSKEETSSVDIVGITDENTSSIVCRTDEALQIQDTTHPILNTTVQTQSQDNSKLVSAFCCPITNQLFKDPVVASDGETYEKSAYCDNYGQVDDETLYPNRALKIIMDDMISNTSNDACQSNWRRVRNMAKLALNGLLDLSDQDETNGNNERMSEGYYCPITLNLIHDPVIDPQGNTYENAAIENWIEVHGTSPVTRSDLDLDQLRRNHIIKRLLDEERSKPADSVHPEIVQWREEPVPKVTDIEYGGSTVATSLIVPDVIQTQQTPSLSDEQRREDYCHVRRHMIYNVVAVFVCVLLLTIINR